MTNVGTGIGMVTSSHTGINCGTDCSEPYASGTEVILTASPAEGSVFAGWSEDSDCSDAGAFQLRYYYSTDSTITPGDIKSEWYCALSGLATGATSTCNGPIGVPLSLSPGTYYLGAIVDDPGAITESDENNNARSADTERTVFLKAFTVSGSIQ
ncbi:MAG: hypothetical protein HYY20_03290 [Candidatus Tectomicrobia bacterium]|uniref:Bacterial repeat domain-containing protein n=1 Tax=Tectimicrobiota bacterium TaxID=2528274 RepID=A0A932CMW3_UNCTE|nr:hypothetical protein [Candidatus Tectomicrobia bacterium]